MMNVPLLDLKRQYSAIKTDLELAIAEVMESQQFILGPQVRQCEEAIAEYSNCSFGVGVSSGTDALLICLMAEDIGRGDEVITTPFTFFSTAGSIARVGARPVFLDIDPATYNIDPTQLEAKVTDRTRAIVPVHLYGQMADMEPIMDVADRHGLVVIEDAAQAIGAERSRQRAGSVGHYGCFSFFPSKNLGCAGDGGMVVTNDAHRATKLRSLRVHGSKPKYYHAHIGGNLRLDALQAAIVCAKLPYLEAWTAARQRNASRYRRLLSDTGLLSESSVSGQPKVILPEVAADRHVFNQYVIRTAQRDQLGESLQQSGVSTEIYYPVPMHLQECFSYLGHRIGAFPHSETAATETLALPIYPELTEVEAEYVVACVEDFFTREDVLSREMGMA